MFSDKFENIIKRQPTSAQALSRVSDYLAGAADQHRLHKLRLDPTLIRDIGQIASSTELAELIKLLLSERILRRVVVVESPAGGGVAEFASMDEVPEKVHDHMRDMWIRVTPSNLRTFYVAEAG